MLQNTLHIAVDTLIELSSLITVPQEDLSSIRNYQDNDLIHFIEDRSTYTHLNTDERPGFYIGNVDLMPVEDQGQLTFKLLEVNGSGLIGLFNLTTEKIQETLTELTNLARYFEDYPPCIIIPILGTIKKKSHGSTSLLYEKIVMAEALKEKFIEVYGEGQIKNLYNLIKSDSFRVSKPTVVIGYVQDLMNLIQCSQERLMMGNQPISSIINDRLCHLLLTKFRNQVNLSKFYPLNSCFSNIVDKGASYSIFNKFISHKQYHTISGTLDFEKAFTRQELIDKVKQNLVQGKKTVIKPCNSATGRGIDFFLDPAESMSSITAKIDAALLAMKTYSDTESYGFPYTIVEFFPPAVIKNSNPQFNGRKFELRIIVYQYNNTLKAIPSIAKVTPYLYNPDSTDRTMQLNNICAMKGKFNLNSFNPRLPLANYNTLELLGIDPGQLIELCHFSTEFIASLESTQLFQTTPDTSSILPIFPTL